MSGKGRRTSPNMKQKANHSPQRRNQKGKQRTQGETEENKLQKFSGNNYFKKICQILQKVDGKRERLVGRVKEDPRPRPHTPSRVVIPGLNIPGLFDPRRAGFAASPTRLPSSPRSFLHSFRASPCSRRSAPREPGGSGEKHSPRIIAFGSSNAFFFSPVGSAFLSLCRARRR